MEIDFQDTMASEGEVPGPRTSCFWISNVEVPNFKNKCYTEKIIFCYNSVISFCTLTHNIKQDFATFGVLGLKSENKITVRENKGRQVL